MKKFKAVLLLALLSSLAALTVFYGGVSAAFYMLPEETQSAESDLASSYEEQATEIQEQSNVPQQIEPDNTPSQAETSSAVPTIENHTVSGKIITRFIDPKGAPLKYNNVYLKNNTDAKIDIKTELEKDIKIKIEKNSSPQVLIVHTHATESFMQEDRDYYTTADVSRSTDNTKNMVAVGERIAAELTAAGIGVLHDKTLHDYPSYTGSYSMSAKTIKSYLSKYPSIKVVLDVHRDAIGGGGADKVKVVKEIDGKKAAQVMLVMGSQTGTVTNFPNWKLNLRLAMRFHSTIENMYPGLARPILLMSKKYNEQLTTGSMLLEIGTDANTMDEALYSGTLAGKALATFLSELK